MIKKYVFGNPLDTGAVTENMHAEDSPVEGLTVTSRQGKITFSRALEPNDRIYGLGENVRGINKRGWIYESYSNDDGIHSETLKSIYGAHNFIVFDCKTPFGVFVDAPFKVTFDLAYSDMDEAVITSDGTDLKLYMVYGTDILDIVRCFRKSIGKSYKAPFWAFGYIQSRWGYKSADECRSVVREFRDNKVPLDGLCLDLDYMDGFRVFTTNPNDFPDFEKFAKEMRGENVHLIPIIDAAVKAEKGYGICDEGVAGNYFCKDENGGDYLGCVWPGRTYFPDYLNEKAGEWFSSKYSFYTKMGIDGFWNDMNEPAIFYGQSQLDNFRDKVIAKKDEEYSAQDYFDLRHNALYMWDYKDIYHNINGKKVRHDRVHNLYGYKMTQSAAKGLEGIEPDKRFLLFSRSSYIGMHRYAGIWTGDNQAWWSHLLLSLQQLPSLNMCGFLYLGSDIGGFNSNTTEDLSLRWHALSVFVPLMRNHNGSDRAQEWFSFKHKEWFRDIIKARYRILPFIYSEYLKAAENYDMMFKPLSFVYKDDETTAEIEDQLIIGDSVMIAPVYKQNAKGRFVYLPEEMLMVKMYGETIETEEFEKGWQYVEVPYNCVLFFIKKGALVPLYDCAESTADLDKSRLSVLCFCDEGNAEYEMFTDDGVTKSGKIKKLEILVENEFAYCNSNNIKVNVLADYLNNLF